MIFPRRVTFPNILDLNGFIEETNCKQDSQPQPQPQPQPTQMNSPDKCSTADKMDDASTADSGSVLDAEESNSVGFSASNQTPNDSDMQVRRFLAKASATMPQRKETQSGASECHTGCCWKSLLFFNVGYIER